MDLTPFVEELSGMTEEQITDVFRPYKFEDANGHPLENCVYFIALVRLAARKKEDDRVEWSG